MDKPKLTIGFAHHSDFHGAYFTIQDIRKELLFNRRFDLLKKIQFVVVENAPDSPHAKELERLVKHQVVPQGSAKHVTFADSEGTSSTRNRVVQEADGDFVIVMDCHVLLCPVIGILDKLFKFMEENPNTDNFHSGPLVYDDMMNVSTHFNDEWRAEMWGTWGAAWRCKCNNSYFTMINIDGKAVIRSLAEQKEIKSCPSCGIEYPDVDYSQHEGHFFKQEHTRCGYNPDEEPFEIPMNGLGLFFVRKDAWLKFNEHARGFGGEEGYIHMKYKKAGRKTMCLPFLRWVHRFPRPDGVHYPLTLENKLRNYVLNFTEIGADLSPVKEHFIVPKGRMSEDYWNTLVKEANELHRKPDVQVKQKRQLPFVTCLCPTYKKPKFLSNVIKCFESQKYEKDRCELIVLDDAGHIEEQQGTNWKIVSQEERFPNVWNKFSHMKTLAREDTDIFIVWEDDDIYLPWHLIAMASKFKRDTKQFFAPKFAYGNNPHEKGDVIKELVTGRFHGSWGYSKDLWNAVNGYDQAEAHEGWKLMWDKCSKTADETVEYEGVAPSYVYRFVRSEMHIHDIKDLSTYNQAWNYSGYIPTEKVGKINPEFDEETKLICGKFKVKTG